MVKNGESSKAIVAAAPEQTPQQMFAALGKFFKIQSDALLKFAGSDAADEVDAEAMSALLGGLQASASALGFSASGKPLTSDQLVRAEKKRKRLDKKAAKDPNAPKRPASAYLLYQNECRDAVKSSMPEGTAYAETLKKIGEMWKELTPEAKQVYTNKANNAMGEFKIINEAYSKEKGDVTLKGIKAAITAGADGSDDEDEDEEDEEAADAATSDSDEDESEDEAPPPPPPTKKSKKAAAAPEPVAATPKKEKKAKAAAAAAPVEAAPAKKSKKDKKASA